MLDLSRVASLGEALRDATYAFASQPALFEADRHRERASYRYLELRQAAEAMAGGLQARDFGAGDRCAILLSNQSKWVISGVGALWAGAVLVPLDYKLTAPEQAVLLRHAQPRVLVTEYGIWRALAAEWDEALQGTEVWVTEAPEGADLGVARRWEDAQASEGFEAVARQRDDLCCIVYSSGTGGTPKGCMLSHGNYLAQAEVLGRMYPMESSDRYFSILPTNHAIDFMCGMVVPFLFGAAVVHQRTLRPEFLTTTMQRYGITHMALVPRLLKVLETRVRERIDALPDWQRLAVEALIGLNEMATAREPKHRLSRTLLKPLHAPFGGRLKLIFCGGAFVPADTAMFFYRIGLPVVIGYGLTEACTVITLNDLQPFRADSVGPPVPGTEVKLASRDRAGVGEVLVRGPTVMLGYLDAPELTAETLIDGWLHTGDLGSLDAAGHLKLVGRAKNMIVTAGGKNVYPEDVESAFEDLPGVAEHCVFAESYVWPTGKLTDERLLLVVRLATDAGAEAGDTNLERTESIGAGLLDAINQRNRRLADYKRLSAVIPWSAEFPRTASMKVKRQELAQQLRAAQDASRALTLLEEGLRDAS